MVEQEADTFLDRARDEDVALLVVGASLPSSLVNTCERCILTKKCHKLMLLAFLAVPLVQVTHMAQPLTQISSRGADRKVSR